MKATRPWPMSVHGLIALVLLLAALWAPQVHASDGDLTGHDGNGCWNPAGVSKGVIALDPGHGASDGGATNTVNGVTLWERDLVLDIAGRTKEILVTNEYRVCLTRTTNHTNPTNTQRAQYANSVGAKLFVLIHLNGLSDPTVNYTQTFWGKKNKDLTFTQHMAAALDGLLAHETARVGQFASGALLKSNMPATLTESVFLTNHEEAARLQTDERRQEIAQALAKGIMDF